MKAITDEELQAGTFKISTTRKYGSGTMVNLNRCQKMVSDGLRPQEALCKVFGRYSPALLEALLSHIGEPP